MPSLFHNVFSTFRVDVYRKTAQVAPARQRVTLTRWARKAPSLHYTRGVFAAVLYLPHRQQLLPSDRPTASRLRPSLDPSRCSIVRLGANGEIGGGTKDGRADPVQVRTGSPQRTPQKPKGSIRPTAAPAGGDCICVCTTRRRGANARGRPSSRVKAFGTPKTSEELSPADPPLVTLRRIYITPSKSSKRRSTPHSCRVTVKEPREATIFAATSLASSDDSQR